MTHLFHGEIKPVGESVRTKCITLSPKCADGVLKHHRYKAELYLMWLMIIVFMMMVQMCIFLQGMVAVLHIPQITTWPIVGDGMIKVIRSDGEVDIVKHGTKDAYFTSDTGGVVSLQLLPFDQRKHMSELK